MTLDEILKKSKSGASSSSVNNLDDIFKASKSGIEADTFNTFPQAVDTGVNQPTKLKRSLLTRIDNLTARPKEEDLGTDAKKNMRKFLPSAIAESLPFGVGEIIKQSRDDYETVARVNFEDILGGIRDTSKGVFAGIIGTGASLYPKPLKFNMPVLGEISNLQYNAAQRIAQGENTTKVILEEGVVNNVFGVLMLAGLAGEITGDRPTTIKSAEFKGETPSGIKVKEQPKNFRLYQEPVGTQALTPEIVQKLGVNLGSKYNPELPTYFKITGTGKGTIKGEIVQIKPSYLETFLKKFGTDITKTPDNMIVPLATREISPKQLEGTKINIVPESTPTIISKTDIAPKIEEILPAIKNSTTPDEHLISTARGLAEESGDKALINKVEEAIALSEKNIKATEEVGQKMDEIIQRSEQTPEKELIEPTFTPYRPARAVPESRVYDTERFVTGEFEGKPYSTDAFILEFNTKLDIPRKKGSTFPTDAPKEEAVKRIIPDQTEAVSVKPVKVQVSEKGKQAFVQLEGDGITVDVQQKYYDYFNKKYPNTVFMAVEPNKPIVVLSKGEMVGLVMPAQLKNFGTLTTTWEKPKPTQPKLKNPPSKTTQKKKVAEAIKESPKTIREIAEQTEILEPNVRRILGVGAKEGVFERVDKGVYVLSKNGKDLAYIQTANAVEALPDLAKEGFKADMIFLDIPYDTQAVKGGNRGVKYDLLSVEDFGIVLDSIKKIAKSPDSPIIHMYSQAESGLKAMSKYNNLFIEKGFIPVGKGQYQKTFKDGSPTTGPNGKVSKPEGILVFTQSGNLKKDLKDLNFTLRRPKGYQTEKPAEMLEAMIKMTTNEGDIVLDPFAGSGVTGAEAIRAGRKAYLIEKNPDVVEGIIKPRIKGAMPKDGSSGGLSRGDLGSLASPQGNKTIRKIIEKQSEAKVEDVQEVPKDFKISARAKAILEEFGVPIAEKTLSNRLLGVYKHLSKNVRVQALYDVTTVTHEAVHAIDDQIGFSKKLIADTGRGAEIRNRLTDIYEEIYPKAKRTHKLDKRIKEGLAVFFENYFYDPASIQAKYPDLVDTFIKPTGQYYNSQFSKLLEKMNELVDDYAKLTPEQRIASRIRTGKEVVDKQKGFTWKQRIEYELFNRFEPLKRYAKENGVAGTWDDPLVQAFNILNKNSIITNWVKGKDTPILLANGNFKIEKGSVADYLKMVKGHENEFRAYLVARRVVADNNSLAAAKNSLREIQLVELEGIDITSKFGKEIQELNEYVSKLEKTLQRDDFSLQDASAVVEKYAEKFKEAAKLYDDINKRLIEFSEESGLLDSATANTYKSEPGYASFRRYIDEELQSIGSIQTSSKSKVTSFKERTGSQLDIVDPVYSQILSINEIIGKGMENRLWERVANLTKDNPEVARRFERIEAVPSLDAEGRITFPQEKDPNIIRVFRNGKREFYRVAPEFVAVSKQLRGKEHDAFIQFLRIPSSVFTRLTTSANPFFAVGNITVDQFSALAQTKTGFVPVVDPVKSLISYVQGDKGMNAYIAMGGKRQTLAAFYDLSPEDIAHKLTGGETKLEKTSRIIDSSVGMLELPSNISEIMTRYAEYSRAVDNGDQMSVAMYKAADVTTPFQLQGNIGGRFGQEVIKSIPYFNAIIQVLYKYGRSTKENPKRMGSVIAGLFTLGLSAAIMTYKSASEEQKRLLAEQPVRNLSRYLYFPTPDGKTLIKMKIPEQMGIFTGMAYLYTAEHYGQNKATFDDYVNTISSAIPEQVQFYKPKNMLLSWLPQVIKPSIQVASNTKTFPEIGPIVPPYMVDKAPKEQYNVYTSEVAKTIGAMMNISPTKTEYWVRNQFGVFGGLVFGKLPGNPLWMQEKDYVMTGRSYNRFYENRELVKQQYDEVITNDKVDQKYSQEEKQIVKSTNHIYTKVSDLLSEMRDINKTTELPEEIKSSAYELLLNIDSTENIRDVEPLVYKLSQDVQNFKQKNTK